MSYVPPDPTKPKDPLIIARPRPGTVTLAGTLMLAGAALGLLNAVLVIAATGAATSEFRARAGLTAATADQIDDIATGLATWSTTAGLAGLLLSVVLAVLALQVLHGSHGARLAALGFIAVAILFGLGWASFTVRGSANLHPAGMDEQTGRSVAEALGGSTAGLPTYVGGGLTCVQVLGYATVLGLLLWPASRPYFRRGRPSRFGGRRAAVADRQRDGAMYADPGATAIATGPIRGGDARARGDGGEPGFAESFVGAVSRRLGRWSRSQSAAGVRPTGSWWRGPATWFGAWNRAAWLGRRRWLTAVGSRGRLTGVRYRSRAMLGSVRQFSMRQWPIFARLGRWLMLARWRGWITLVGRRGKAPQAPATVVNRRTHRSSKRRR
jgi:hypothetical protein